jgi:putative phosphoribosyl transferase
VLFKDRSAAGQLLAGQLRHYAQFPNRIVLGLPRGGVPVAFEVARALQAPLDIVLVRKLGVPGQQELAMGAIASGGIRVLNQSVLRSLNIQPDVIERVAAQEEQELHRREQLYREGRPGPTIEGQTVLLVDDGLATGATMRAAVMALRQQQPAHLVVAVPVAALEACQEFAEVADGIYCAQTPEPFQSVGLWYDNFAQTTDEEVQDLLRQAVLLQQQLV